MPQIVPMRPELTGEAKRMIYSVAHELFHEQDTLEESIALYESQWTLRDVDDFQHAYNENGGVFLATMDGERLVGTGALKRLEDGVGELKRLWLLPEYQGQGLGYAMMQRLLEAARAQGYTRVRLETSAVYQTRAYAFYKRVGFYDIPGFGEDAEDPDNAFLEMLV